MKMQHSICGMLAKALLRGRFVAPEKNSQFHSPPPEGVMLALRSER